VEDAAVDVIGPLGLTLLFLPSEPLIDFIFVHGLGGGSRKTWALSKDPSHYWPQEWLPRDSSFKNVRIHAFGYASKWTDRKSSVLNVHDFAKSLVSAIQDSPHMGSGQQTPIVLIGHSMGGLVIKKAYMIAREDPIYNALGQRFHSMMFLGTPHRGSGLAKVLDYSLKSMVLLYGAKAYVDDLHTDSVMLQLINDGFRHISGDLQLRSFYEVVETQMGPTSSLIVNRESAVLGYPNEQSALINATHRGLCKFASPSEANYATVRNALASITKDIEDGLYHQNRDQQNQLQVLEKFLGVHESSQSEDILAAYEEQQIEGSGRWLTTSETFLDWRDGIESGPKMFWVNGQPGAGKSFLAAHVASSLKELNLDCSYFFMRHGDKSSSTLELCLRSLAFQMASMNPKVRQEILAMQQNDIHFDHDEPRALWRKLFVGGIFRATFERTQYWIIDALDECHNYSALFPLLSKLDSRLPLCVFITSRPSTVIHKQFSQLRNTATQTASPENTLGDIKAYVSQKVKDFDIDHAEYAQKITSSIIEKSEGCFLWAVLVIDELENAFSQSEIDRILIEVPVGMNPLYERILDGMSQSPRGKSLVKAVLIWSACATRALTVEELQAALQLQTKESGIFALEKFISSTCGHLVYVDGYKKVRMIHHTAKEFLLRDDLESELAIKICDAHGELADTCLQYLISEEMKAPRSRKLITPTDQRIKKRSPFADYACTSFADHIKRACTTNDALIDLLGKFLLSNVLSWVEAVAAKGTLSPLILAVKNLRDFLEFCEKQRVTLGRQLLLIGDWSTDLERIATKFGKKLLESPTAIYWLIPSFCPLESLVKTQFGSFPGGASVTGLSNSAWNDRLACKTYYDDQAGSTIFSDKHFAVGMSSGNVHLYFQDTFQEARILKHSGRRDPVKFMAFDTSGGLLLCAGVRSIRLWNALDTTELWNSALSVPPVTVLFSEGDTTVISISNQNTLTTRETLTGKIISSRSRKSHLETQRLGFRPSIECAAYSVEHNLFSVVYRGLPIEIYTIDDNEFLGACAREEVTRDGRGDIAPLSIIFNPNSDLNLIAALYLDGDLALYDTLELDLLKVVSGAAAKSLAASPDGRTLATGDAAGIIEIYDFETLNLIYRIVGPDQSIRSMSFSADNMRLLEVRATHANIWEPSLLVRGNVKETNSVSDPIPMNPKTVCSEELYEKGNITAIATFPAWNIIFCGIDDGSVGVYDSNSGRPLKTLFQHGAGVSTLRIAFGSRSKILATADTSGHVLVRKVMKEGDQVECSEPFLDHAHPFSIVQLLLNPLEDRLLVSMAGLCTVWNLASTAATDFASTSYADSRVWSTDIDDHGQLIAISCSSPHTLTKHSWVSLDELSFVNITDLGEHDTPRKIFTGIKDKLIVEYSVANNNQNRRILILGSTSGSKTEGLGSSSLVVSSTILPQEIRCVIGTHRSMLLFLDKSAWVSSIDCSDEPTAVRQGKRSVAKSKTEDREMATKHTFLPDDWLSTDSKVILEILPNSKLLFVNGHEVAIISKAL